MTDPKKLLARLEAQSRSGVTSRKPYDKIGTSADALQHAPPRTPQWKRRQTVVNVLRLHLWRGASRVHTPAATHSLRDQDATENIDIAGALAYAARNSVKRALAVNVYLYRNWPHFAQRSKNAMITLTTLILMGRMRADAREPWVREMVKLKQADVFTDLIVATVLEEFTKPTHCEACEGHGTEQTGPRVGQVCAVCAGEAKLQWKDHARAEKLRVRKRDWNTWWRIPYLFLLDFLIELDRVGARAHRHAIGE